METVTVSPKFQVVIPLAVRQRLKLQPGAKLMVVAFNGGLRLMPLQPAARVLDSSCWLEFFADTDRADLFATVIEDSASLVVPVITVHEVTKKLAREAGDEVATAALSLMQRGRIVPVDLALALDAALNGLPLADSLIYATARRHGAELWTQDSHVDGLAGVRYFAKG